MASFLISQQDWSLHRKGHIDQQRHQEKVKEAIKEHLPDIVSEESIILSNGNKIIKVPIRSLQEYRFRFDPGQGEHVGQGQGGTQPGKILGSDAGKGNGGGGAGAGSEPGVDYYEAEITLEELADMIFEDLRLPNLKDKRAEDMETISYRFNDIRRAGLMGNLDRKRTLLANLRRNATRGEACIGNISREDMRFKTWTDDRQAYANAIILAMMDTSGSMGNFEKYIARSFFYWMVRFLRTRYQKVDVVFIAHHTLAKEVTEEEFFTRGESGGTRCSSAYQLALKLIAERYPPQDYNIYPFHFSDGDNLPSDNDLCIDLVQKLLEVANIVGYGEISGPFYRGSSLMQSFRRIKDPRLITVSIKDKADVYPALQKFFSEKEVEASVRG